MESLKVSKIKHVYDMFMILEDQHFIFRSTYSHEELFNNERFQNRSFLSGNLKKKNLNKKCKLQSNDVSSVPEGKPYIIVFVYSK